MPIESDNRGVSAFRETRFDCAEVIGETVALPNPADQRIAGTSATADANLDRAKAFAIFRAVDCLIFFRENRLDTGRFKGFPASMMRPYFKYVHGK